MKKKFEVDINMLDDMLTKEFHDEMLNILKNGGKVVLSIDAKKECDCNKEANNSTSSIGLARAVKKCKWYQIFCKD